MKINKMGAAWVISVARVVAILTMLLLALGAGALPEARAATFAVTYADGDGTNGTTAEGFNDPTLGAARRNAFEASLSYWAQHIGSASTTITVKAQFDPLGGTSSSATLGRAGPANFYIVDSSPTGNPRFQANTIYGAALGNHVAGGDLNGATAEINATFNSDVDNSTVLGNTSFYYGTDGKPGSDSDFYSVALHEVGHGLNFLSNISTNGTFAGSEGNPPGIYDRFLTLGSDAARARLTALTSAQRSSAIVSGNLFFDGARAQSGNGGAPAKIYAPNPYQGGSSVSHLDEATFSTPNPNELMTPINSGVAHDAGPVGLGVFYDMGWYVPPFVSSIARAAASPVNSTSVRFVVTFTAPVTGVDVSDFAVVTTGTLSGAGVIGVSGSGTTYIVTVSTGRSSASSAGTVRLDVADNDSISAADGIALGGAGTTTASGGSGSFSTGAVYSINASGAVLSLVAVGSGNTNVVGVDLLNGNAQSVIASGFPFAFARGVARASDGTLYVVNTGTYNGDAGPRVAKISPSGAASTLATDSTGTFGSAFDAILSPDGQLLYVATNDKNAIVTVNTTTGAETVFASGNLLSFPRGLAFGPDGQLYVGNNNGVIVKVNPSTAAQTSYCTTGLNISYIAFGAGGTLYATANSANQIISIASGGGSQAVVTSGGSLSTPLGITFGGDGSLYVANEGNNSIVKVTLSPVAQTVVTSGGSLSSVSDVVTAEVPPPSITVSDAQVLEGNSGSATLTFTARLSGPISQAASVNVSTADGTANAGSDYVALANSTVTIAAGATSQTFSVAINGDLAIEPSETFSVNLSNPVNATVGTASAIGTITNDDATLATSGAIISEFRFHGLGSSDEYVEIANATGSLLNIGGWKLQYSTSGNATTFSSVLPVGTTLLPRGRLLWKGDGYTLSPSNFTMAGDALDNSGVALLNASGATVDAAGFASSPAAQREGSGLLRAPTADGQYAFVRLVPNVIAQDSGNNASDFLFVSTTGATFGAENSSTLASILGAPGPENMGDAILRNAQVSVVPLDASRSASLQPNRVRTAGNGGSAATANGTMRLRFRLRNLSSQPLSRIRFRMVRITTLGNTSAADVRVITSANESNVPISGGGSIATVYGTTLQAPADASVGGGLNTGAGLDVTLTTPLAPAGQPGDELPYSILLGVATTGNYSLNYNIEAAPGNP